LSISIDTQILITRSSIDMLTDLHNFESQLPFPHFSRTGLAQSQVFDLITGLYPLTPYYFRRIFTATTASPDGNLFWTFIPEYSSADHEELLSWKEETERAVAYLKDRLFHDRMPDYLKVYRACAFLCGMVRFENDSRKYAHIGSAYGALSRGSCSCSGYSHALKLLLDAAGVPSMQISGSVIKDSPAFRKMLFDYDPRSRTSRHCWNLVGIETPAGIQYFHVDTAWGQNSGEMSFEYFLKDDSFMKNYLKWEYDAYPICNALPGTDMEKLIKNQ